MGMNQSIVRRVKGARLAAALAPPVSSIIARVSINIRPATLADLPFIDRLQKAQTHEVGFLPTKAIEGKVRLQQCLIAEVAGRGSEVVGREQSVQPTSHHSQPTPTQVGYLIASDRYFKRDEIGYITQINVVPEFRRSLVAGSLLQAQFDRSAYGCKLYACWCAQDLVHANEFWAAMGFTAIAFRTGSRTRGQKSEVRGQKRARIHIFWQKRVRAEDTGDVKSGGTPWWYPSQTGGGEMREDRLVFPIPPGVSWRDVLPVVLSGDQRSEGRGQSSEKKKPRVKKVLKSPRMKGGLWFAHEGIVEKVGLAKLENTAKPTIDPRLTKMARELRDRWTEQQSKLILPAPAKHDVRRMIADESQTTLDPMISHPALGALPRAA